MELDKQGLSYENRATPWEVFCWLADYPVTTEVAKRRVATEINLRYKDIVANL